MKTSLFAFSLCSLFLCTVARLRAEEASAAYLRLPETDEGLPGAGPIRRYDWFQSLWNQRRAGWAKEVAKDQGALVFLGDSITQGWGSLAEDFDGVKVANRGISGDTTRGMLLRLTGDVLALNPSGVVLLMGTNDLEEGAAPETIASNLKLILTSLKEHNATMPIVLCDVFPSDASKSRPADKIREINKLYHEVVKGDAQVQVVDTWALFANKEGNAKLDEFPDLLHPNPLGYAKWAAALRPVFATLGFVEKEADPFELEEGYESLFNGKDLTGWGYRVTTEAMRRQAEGWQKSDRNAPPWPFVDGAIDFSNRTASPDGRYVAKNGRLIVTYPPEGRKIQQMWTMREFEGDFTLKLEFRATPNADSGVFLREPQLQCRDYVLAGPYNNLKGYKPQDWNEMIVVVNGDSARCTVNGEVIEEAFKVPAKGPIGLEGDRGQMEYRRLRIKR